MYINRMIDVYEIFRSLQGETTAAGFPSVFVRLSGCNLRCRYCDTKYAYETGTMMEIGEIVNAVRNYPVPHHITLTGGEPLIQNEAGELVRALRQIAPVRIETNGSVDISGTDSSAIRIVDVKTPSSGEGSSFLKSNLSHMTPDDEIKFVVGSDEDLRFTSDFIRHSLNGAHPVINISPSEGMMTAARCASFILDDNINARINLQLHKIVWPDGEKK